MPVENERPRSLDVAIAGAGPIGLLSALVLCQQGMKVKIFERVSKEKLLSDTGAGFDLSPSTGYIFEKLGMYEEVKKYCKFYHTMHFTTTEGDFLRERKHNFVSKTKLGDYKIFPISRSFLQRLLMDRLAEYEETGLAEVKYSCQIVSFDDKEVEDKVKLFLKQDSESIEAECDVLLGCDGIHSKVRKHLVKVMNEKREEQSKPLIEDNMAKLGVTGWWAKMDFDTADAIGKKHGMAFDNGIHFNRLVTKKLPLSFLANVVPESFEDPKKRNVIWNFFVRDEVLAPGKVIDGNQSNDLTKRGGVSGDEAKDLALTFFHDKAGNPKIKNPEDNYIFQMIKATDAKKIVQVGMFDRENLNLNFSHGRVCLLGDAAHPQTPSFGQGLSMGACDAYCISLHLASLKGSTNRLDIVNALKKYDNQERRKSSKSIVKKGRDEMKRETSTNWFTRIIGRLVPKYIPAGILLKAYEAIDLSNVNAIIYAESQLKN